MKKIAMLGLCMVCILGFFMMIGHGALADELPRMTITYAHGNPTDPTFHTHAAALEFKKQVEALSNGRITVNIAGAGELGGNIEIMEQVMDGEIEIGGSLTDGVFSQVFPDIQIASIPYLFEDTWHALQVFRPNESEFGQEFFEAFRVDTGIKVIGVFQDGDFLNFGNNVRPVRSPEDLTGVRIRTMGIASHMATVEALGASVTPVPFGELYTAIETGVVDGSKTSAVIKVLASLHEVQKYYTLTQHMHLNVILSANDAWFQGLPPEYQEIVLRAGREAELAGQRQSTVGQSISLEIARRAGVEVYIPTEEEMEVFKVTLQEPVTARIREVVRNPEWVDRIFEAADEARAKLGYDKL